MFCRNASLVKNGQYRVGSAFPKLVSYFQQLDSVRYIRYFLTLFSQLLNNSARTSAANALAETVLLRAEHRFDFKDMIKMGHIVMHVTLLNRFLYA